MQIPNERQNAKTKKEVIVFIGQDWKLYYFDGELPPRLYEEVIPIIKKSKKRKRKRKREFPDDVIKCSIDSGNAPS